MSKRYHERKRKEDNISIVHDIIEEKRRKAWKLIERESGVCETKRKFCKGDQNREQKT